MKLNLRIKLIGGFIIILFLMVVVGGLGIYTSKTIQNRLERAVEQDVKAANILGDVARRVGFIHSNSQLHLITRSIDDMDRYESEIADWDSKINTDLDFLENTFKDRATLDELAEFRAAWDTYLRIWREQVVPLSRANRDKEAFALIRKRGTAGKAAREAMFKLDELHNTNVVAASHRLELAEQDFRKSQRIALAVVLVAITLGLIFGIKHSSHIAGAVNTVSKAARLVAAGDFNQRVTVKTGDEIESMADSFNTMTGKMKKMVEELQNEITERKLAEETLAASKAYTESIIQNFLDTLIVVDTEAKIKTVNPATCHLLGYTEEGLIGQPVSIIFAEEEEEEEEEEVNRFFQFFQEPEKSKALNPKDTIRNKELNYKTKGGQLIPMSFNASVLTDEAGNVAGV
ncbi:MAG: MCP four helix bundle domain-containing protein, partial [bacterium]